MYGSSTALLRTSPSASGCSCSTSARGWRNVILSVSDIWNILNISPDSKLEGLSHCLSLCGSSPLDVRFWNDFGPEFVTDFLGLLRPKLATIKHLALQEFHLGYENSPFGDLLSLDMPMLQELRIISSASSNGSYCDVDMHRYPVLQRLELTRAVCPLNIKTLRILHLRNWELLSTTLPRRLCSNSGTLHATGRAAARLLASPCNFPLPTRDVAHTPSS